MNPNRNYLFLVFPITLLVIVLLAGISQLPAFNVADIFIKRVNILSDVLPREDDSIPTRKNIESEFDTLLLAESEAEVLNFMDSSRVSETLLPDTNPQSELTQHWDISSNESSTPTTSGFLESSFEPGQPIIEDYGTDSPAMEAFYRAWDDPDRNRPLRIAVLGDSFIEGDILTADLREQLQNLCGGNGVGFVPFATNMAKFRASVLHQYDHWEIVTLQQRNALPEEMRDKFFISGNFAIPAEGATSRLSGTHFKQHLEYCHRARLLFINQKNTQIDVLINDSISRRFSPPSGEQVQQIIINAPIYSIQVTLSQPEGFIGYGIILEDRNGVSVDNFSIRGNSGLALYGTNRSINNQIARLAAYDLVILQYGLNVLSADVTQYDYYGQKFVNVIRYMQQCFPNSSILVLGVGDRCTQREGEFVTMPGVYGMIEAQRGAAQEAGVAFWDTFEAMGGPGSMVRYVHNKWAAQDYTHIRHPGGREIATQLVASLVHGKEGAAQAKIEQEQWEEEQRLRAVQYSTHLQEFIEGDSLLDNPTAPEEMIETEPSEPDSFEMDLPEDFSKEIPDTVSPPQESHPFEAPQPLPSDSPERHSATTRGNAATPPTENTPHTEAEVLEAKPPKSDEPRKPTAIFSPGKKTGKPSPPKTTGETFSSLSTAPSGVSEASETLPPPETSFPEGDSPLH